MWTGYSNENDENAKIIIVLIKDKNKKKTKWQAWLELKAIHATFPPEFH